MMIQLDEPEICLVGGQPIDRQIYEQVRTCILVGQLRPGEQLPSLRALAVALAVNPDAVERAYALLEQDGLVSCAEGSGMRVLDVPLAADSRRRRLILEQFCADFLARAAQLGFTPNEVLAAAANQGRLESW